MFRIDRKFVNLAGTKILKLDADGEPEAGAEGDFPDAAASAEALANEYLNAAELEAKARTDEMLEKACAEAKQILADARDEAEREFERAGTEGYEKGLAKGLEEGKHSFDEELTEKINQDNEMLKKVLDEIYEERERTYNELEDEVAGLALEIVRKIIHPPEIDLVDIFTPLIKNALRQMSTDGKIIIRVGAKEYERFFSSGAATIELDSGVTVTASVLRDVSLRDGDLIIDTDDVTVNAGIDSQLQYVKLAFDRANQYEPD